LLSPALPCLLGAAPQGWKLVTLLRLSPIAPWNVLNYALSVTAVPLYAYVLASSLAVSECCCWQAAVGGQLLAGGCSFAYVLASSLAASAFCC